MPIWSAVRAITPAAVAGLLGTRGFVSVARTDVDVDAVRPGSTSAYDSGMAEGHVGHVTANRWTKVRAGLAMPWKECSSQPSGGEVEVVPS
ncbi:hypothetical protein ACIBFB_27150 [Nocardiopsis sp. NPDC050513]|uniref:hypothetical protein n=1 Tax=Nocardiopsis sp. NPDC050513 TaxID=3364338 RepID=UPI003798A18F